MEGTTRLYDRLYAPPPDALCPITIFGEPHPPWCRYVLGKQKHFREMEKYKYHLKAFMHWCKENDWWAFAWESFFESGQPAELRVSLDVWYQLHQAQQTRERAILREAGHKLWGK